MLFGHLVGMDESADARRILTAVQFLRVIGKGRQDVLTPPGCAGHYEERPIIPQPQCGRCHRAGTVRPLWKLLAASRAMH